MALFRLPPFDFAGFSISAIVEAANLSTAASEFKSTGFYTVNDLPATGHDKSSTMKRVSPISAVLLEKSGTTFAGSVNSSSSTIQSLFPLT